MTPSQRLKYSILISLVVLGIMFGLSYMQNAGMITEKMFQYIAIGVAVIVVVINGVMRRKTKISASILPVKTASACGCRL